MMHEIYLYSFDDKFHIDISIKCATKVGISPTLGRLPNVGKHHIRGKIGKKKTLGKKVHDNIF